MSLARYLSKLGALLNSSGQVPVGGIADGAVSAAKLAAGAARANFGAGAVLQVVQVVKTDTFSHSNGYTFTDVTGVSASITPTSSSSKILVMWSGSLCQGSSTGGYGLFTRVTRGGSVIVQGDAGGTRVRAATAMNSSGYNYPAQHSFQYLDSPASSSALTYKLQIAIESGSSIIIGGSWQGGSAFNSATPTTLTLMEIAG